MNTKNEKQDDREKYQAQKVQMTFDQMIKNILDHIQDRNIIAFINSLLGISLDTNIKVEKLQTETHIERDEHDMNAQLVHLMHDLKTAADRNMISGESADQIKDYALNVYTNITSNPNASILNKEEVKKAMVDVNETVEVTDYWGAMDRLKADVTAEVTAEADARGAKSIIRTTKKLHGTKEDALESMITDMEFSEEKAMRFIEELW